MRMEEKDYAGRGTTGLAATGTALGGAALAGVLSQGNGLLGGLFGGNNGCHENQPVNRYEMGLVQENGALKQQLALRDSQVYTDQKLSDVVAYFNGKIEAFIRRLLIRLYRTRRLWTHSSSSVRDSPAARMSL